MLRITRQADYGILLLATLAQCPGRLAWTAGDLAEHSHVPLAMVSKILKVLTRGGLLQSQRGPKGGYRLAHPPAQLTLARMVEVLDGPVALTECTGANGSCDQQSRCHIHPTWQQINQTISDALEGITLAEMIRPEQTANKS